MGKGTGAQKQEKHIYICIHTCTMKKPGKGTTVTKFCKIKIRDSITQTKK